MDDVRQVYDARTGKSAGWLAFGFVGPVRPVYGWCSHCRDAVYSQEDFEQHTCSVLEFGSQS